MLAIPRQPSFASLTSSRPSSFQSSFFAPSASASTCASSVPPPTHAPTQQQQEQQSPQTPTQSNSSRSNLTKDQSIHLPLSLPGPGREFEEVDLRRLSLDASFNGAPVGFVLAKLRAIGPSLLRTTTNTILHIPSKSPQLPTRLPCTFPAVDASAGEGCGLPQEEGVLRPSHLLAIHSPDSQRTLLLPIHGLLWASLSPSLARLSCAEASSSPADGPSSLPVVHINLPSSLGVPIVQGWVYLRSKEALLSALLPKPPQDQGSISGLLNPTAATLTASLSHLPSAKLLKHIELLHSLWSIVCALSISDGELWAVMGFAWGIVAGALVLNEKRRVESATAAMTD